MLDGQDGSSGEVVVSRVLIAWIGAVLALVVACGADKPAAAPRPTEGSGATPETAGGRAATSMMCAFVYSLDTLADREMAFDGTLREIVPGEEPTDTSDGTPARGRFEVHRWFTGGSGAEVTVIADGLGIGAVTPGESLTGDVGDRMLVAGDENNAWGCGFTQPYDARVAEDWAGVFGR